MSLTWCGGACSGTTTRKQIEETYAISRRIEGEERALDAALLVITSTEQEVDQQWGLYDGYDGSMASALESRRMSGRAMPHMQVIPPGLDFSSLKVCGRAVRAVCCAGSRGDSAAVDGAWCLGCKQFAASPAACRSAAHRQPAHAPWQVIGTPGGSHRTVPLHAAGVYAAVSPSKSCLLGIHTPEAG